MGERSAAFLHLSVCDQNIGVKAARPPGLWQNKRPSFTSLFVAVAFLHLLVCGQHRRVKGARPSFTSRFVAKTKGGKERGLPYLSVCAKPRGESRGLPSPLGLSPARPSFTSGNRGVKGPCGLSSLLGLWPNPRGARSAAFLHLSVCGQNRGMKGPRPRPSFTTRLVAKTEG